jgi:hypothetical protein
MLKGLLKKLKKGTVKDPNNRLINNSPYAPRGDMMVRGMTPRNTLQGKINYSLPTKSNLNEMQMQKNRKMQMQKELEMAKQKQMLRKKNSKLYPRVRSDIPTDYNLADYPSNEFGQITNINNQAIKNQQQEDAYEREIKRGMKTGKSNLRPSGP